MQQVSYPVRQQPKQEYISKSQIKKNPRFNPLLKEINPAKSLAGPDTDNYKGKTISSVSKTDSEKSSGLGKLLKYGAGALGLYFLYKFAKNNLGLFNGKPKVAEA